MGTKASSDQACQQSPTTSAADLAARFPSLPAQAVAEALIEARRSVRLFGLGGDEEARMTDRIALSLLKQRAGEGDGTPRLDPETHPARRTRIEPAQGGSSAPGSTA